MKVFYALLFVLLTGCYPYKVGGPKIMGTEYITNNKPQLMGEDGCDVMVERYDDMEELKYLQMSDLIYLESRNMTAYLDVQLGPTGIFNEVPFLRIKLLKEGCAQEYDAVIFKFSDGTTDKQIHDDGYNCNGIYTFNMTLLGRGPFRKKLANNYVTKIRVYHFGEYSDFSLSVTDQNKIHAAMNCVLQ